MDTVPSEWDISFQPFASSEVEKRLQDRTPVRDPRLDFARHERVRRSIDLGGARQARNRKPLSMPTIFVLNGPNLNLLGLREPHIYGHDTLDDIAGQLEDRARELGLEVDLRQSNHEGHLIDWLHEAQATGAKAVLLNAGGFTHISVALHDAVKSVSTPVIEVHLSNPHAREEFRHISMVGRAARGTIAGFGALSYMLALEAAARI
jgi:3-dehydroquinate dehydratase-2